MSERFKVIVPNGVFRDYPRLYTVVAECVEKMCEETEIAALDPDDIVISGTLKPSHSKEFFGLLRFLNELGYDQPTFVNVDSQQEYEARLAEHVVSVATRLVPSIVPLLSDESRTVPESE